MLSMAMTTNAMGYEQARREALFLTDKMAYELNLTDQQYEAAYEINLDYLMGVTSVDDVYGTYWTRRNLDFGYILLDWQWRAFCAATYFYRPLYWNAGYWHFGIYARYPRRDYFYFSRPAVYISYHGGHSWRSNGGRSYYKDRGRNFHSGTANHIGMRDRWNNGDSHRNNNKGGNSSTRVTVNGNNKHHNDGHSGSRPDGNKGNGNGFGGSRGTQDGNNHSNPSSGSTSGNRPFTLQRPGANTNQGKAGTTTIKSGSSSSFGTARGTTSIVNRPTTTTKISGTPTRVTSTTSRSVNTPTRVTPTTSRSVNTPTRNTSVSTRSTQRPASHSSSSAGNRNSGGSQKSQGGFGGRR